MSLLQFSGKKTKQYKKTASFPQFFHLVCHPATFVGFLFLVLWGSPEGKKLASIKWLQEENVTLIREDKFKDKAHKLDREFWK